MAEKKKTTKHVAFEATTEWFTKKLRTVGPIDRMRINTFAGMLYQVKGYAECMWKRMLDLNCYWRFK